MSEYAWTAAELKSLWERLPENARANIQYIRNESEDWWCEGVHSDSFSDHLAAAIIFDAALEWAAGKIGPYFGVEISVGGNTWVAAFVEVSDDPDMLASGEGSTRLHALADAIDGYIRSEKSK